MLNLRRIGGPLAAGLLLAALSATLAMAQSPLGIGSAEPSIPTSGLFGGFFAWVNMEQQSFYRLLTGALKGMRENPWQLWSLIGLSFAYGVFHAAGPGHGKAVISSYMIANETELKRGVLLSFLSSILQGVVAILLIGAVYLVLRGSSINMTHATHSLEVASYALIAAFGGWLVYRKLRSMARPALAVSGEHAHHDHGSNDPGHHAHSHHHHDHGHAHGPGEVCATCGHAHAPDPALLRGDRFALSEAWSAIVAVGLRPCSGALIVLSFALLNGLYLGGILSVFAMSIGTAITVSILATLAVTAKGFALRYASSQSAAARLSNGIEIAGALLVLVLGLVLLGAALQG
ncbi:nickel/cobalt transporter [Sinorhizobium americanum]|uniref:Nickel/cobalt efflux system n=1 Tax=Sinorhizobium americanum TaxID=194963 RepID=A0A1L3LR41_9HYPH|nr:nickel/cobalt transporter [Sinorhizobium americanum]APG85911.1 nickel ABC transporter, permease protein [Sinorhizobium americanum CCGM7]APG92568.1 nickel ABC transporter, permease protein [Sinorhizobium americanum]OAP35428.1 delayed-early response protein/equilibrative nucleoside transporter [Sinorhizobium americanum]TCN23181.1 ABC-type nickel/cobalt efflux system permease component RcnA [Sinorhizobium americanum]